jgi:hypothetical protein
MRFARPLQGTHIFRVAGSPQPAQFAVDGCRLSLELGYLSRLLPEPHIVVDLALAALQITSLVFLCRFECV